ncbi:glycoside hydrolase 43 family protein [Paenibacillus sp. LS1]|uniref:glycoside hydrolase family 43 protein n=1 Tax=Paenibacillus sp. LS1 TaxID=2992120 RepID=UPI00222EA9E6|nr:glycoside hydrolase 43 family protein [Paenibacillus sp. LS1]MCW3790228.1 glycoside hydrolase 43 family protein [Paenibacillus sp. LS1]
MRKENNEHRYINSGFPQPWGDQGNGRYCNPVLPGDYSDADVVRVGDDYYLASSTFQNSGGVVILHSKDLVNWKTISYAIKHVSVLGPKFNWDQMDNYGHGIFAPSIHYHEGVFRVYVNCYKGEGFFVATAKQAEGPWQVNQLKDKNGKLLRVEPWTDPDAFWDDDGKAYLAAAYLGTHSLYIFQMSPDGAHLLDVDVDDLPGSGTIFYQIEGTEGNKIFKHNGYYFLFNVDFQGRSPAGRGGYIKRSRHLYGTMPDGSAGGPGDLGSYDIRFMGHQFPSQGAFIDTPDGKWYFIGQYDDGGVAGRKVHLIPVTWIDDWPYFGEIEHGFPNGRMTWEAPKPVQGHPVEQPQGSDEFDQLHLSPRWQWNHEPRAEYWSLAERPGHLRLKGFRPLKGGGFFRAGNTLSQRYLMTTGLQVDTKLDLAGMSDGLRGGLVHFNGGVDYAMIGVVQQDGKRRMYTEVNGKSEYGPELDANQTEIWLATRVNAECVSVFYYSTNGTEWCRFGNQYPLRWGGYRGNNIGLYCYNQTENQGYVDIDYYYYSHTGPRMEGEVYVPHNDIVLRQGEQIRLPLLKSDGFGRTIEINSEATFHSMNSRVATIQLDGTITGVGTGVTDVVIMLNQRPYIVSVRVIKQI